MSQSLKRKISTGVLFTTAGSIVNKGVGIVYLLVVLSHLSVHDYGLVELAIATAGLFSILNLGGLHSVIVADVSRASAERDYSSMRRLVSGYFGLRIVSAVVISILLTGLVWIEPTFMPDAIFPLLSILVISFLGAPFRALLITVLTVGKDFGTLTIFRTSEELFKCALVTLLLLQGGGAYEVVLAYVVTDIVITFLLLPYVLFESTALFAGFCLTWSGLFTLRSILRHHAKWSVFLGFFNTGTTNSRPWIIEFFLGTQAVGVYAAAMGIYQSVASLVPLASVLEPVLPQFVHEPSRLARLLRVAIKYQFIITLALVGGMAIVAYPLFGTYLPSYVAAIPLFLWCAVSLLPDATARIFEVAFSALRLQRDLFFSNLTRFMLVLVLLPILVSMFGIIGIALELVITQTVYMWSRYRVLQRHVPGFAITWQDMWRVSDVDRLLLSHVFRPLRRIINHPSL